jgi:Mg-chelatase subunit ChlD
MDLYYYSRVSYARIIAQNTGLSLVEEEGIDMPRTDGRRIFVPKYQFSWDSEGDEASEWWGKFLHEIYHNDKRYDHSKSFDILKKNKDTITQMKRYAYNLLEDHRIEHNENGEYPGRDRMLSHLRNKMFKQFKTDVVKAGTGNPKMDSLYWLQWASFGSWMDDIGYDDIRDSLPVETKKYCDVVEKYIKDIVGLNSAEECWNLTNKIVDELVDDSPKESKGKKCTEVEEGEDDDGEEGEEVKGDYGKFCPHDHESKEYKEGKHPHRVKSVRTGYEHTPAEIVEKNPDELTSPDYYSASIASRAVVDGLAAQIKRYLLVKVRNRTVNNQKTGKVDTAALWKASVYRTSSSGSRVFQKDTEHLNLDTAVTLLVDQSGSMHGDRMMSAAASAVILNEVFSKIGVKTRIISFTDDPRSTYNLVHKDFTEKINKDRLVKRLGVGASWRMSGNADGENILWEYGKIATRMEQKKLMIVLSDGEPADSKTGDIYQFTEDVIKNIEKSKVGIIGIGIESDAVSRFYKRYRVLSHATEIESTLLDILRNEVLHA